MINALFPLVAPIAGTGGSADAYVLANPSDISLSLDSVSYIDDAGVTANDSNYATISVELDGVAVASSSTTTSDLGTIAANTPIAIPVDNGNIVVAPGGKVEIKLAKAGSGVTTAGRCVVVLKPHA